MNNKSQIIGLSGTNGSGKDSAGHLLAEHHGYLFVSVTDILRNELKKRGQEVTRENLRALSAEWRRQSGLGVLIDMAVEQYNVVKDRYAGLVISSLRNSGEADRLHELGGTVLWIDADPKIRYERIEGRGRGAEDRRTYEQFQSDEKAEMNTPVGGDAANLDMAEVKHRADVVLQNDSNDLNNFRAKLEAALHL